MVSENHHAKKDRPFYVKPRFYFYSLLTAVGGLFFIVMLTITALRWVNPPATSFTLQANWDEIGTERYSLTDYWVSADEIPEHMKWAVVASEDQLFWEHWGFDLKSIKEAWDERREGERVRGASTISQQVAKNLFLSPAETLFRKGIEAVLTFFIEILWPKERIMEVYLNVAEFGPGIFGIGKAAETFYDMPAPNISPEQATRLAAVLPSPKRMRVNPPSPYTEERSGWILRQMEQLSGIDYQPAEAKAPSDTVISPEEPDTLTSISDDDFRFSELDSLLKSIDANLSVSDTVAYEIKPDSLRLQE